MCIECGCFVAKKTKSVLEYCPLNKWNPTVYEDDEFPSGVVIKEEIPELLQSFVSDVTSVEHWEEILTWLQKEELGVSTAEIK